MSSLAHIVEREIFPASSTDRLFNFYSDLDPNLDRADGPSIRRQNLLAYIEAAPSRPELLLLAEAPGPNGCRFSGVPFTSEAQIEAGRFPFPGRKSSTAADPLSEYSANIVWGLLEDHFDRVLLWNTVPLHPHRPGEPMSIRTPSTAEIREWGRLVPEVATITRPQHVLAVGRIAERVCRQFEIDATYIRHPSQGGANLFREGVGRFLIANR
ncbi:MAG: uracil-DNA glycosylase [Rhodothermales bacterium]